MFSFDEDTHIYTLDGVALPSVTEIINSVMGVNPYWTKEGRDAGKATHAAIQYYAENDLDYDSLADDTKRRLDAYIKFTKEFQWKPDTIEKPMFHAIFKYAGTPDQIQIGRAIVDFKNGAHLPQHALQLAAYANMQKNPFQYARITVELRDDGTYRMFTYPRLTYQADINVFLSCFNAYSWRKLNGSRT